MQIYLQSIQTLLGSIWVKLTHQPHGLILVQKVKEVAFKWVITEGQTSECHARTVLSTSQ